MKEYDYYSSFLTEGVNEKSLNIDKMSSVEIVKLINDEDKKIGEGYHERFIIENQKFLDKLK